MRLALVGIFVVGLGSAHVVHGAATVTVINRDGPGDGFNDATPMSPVGGNNGATLGEQRLIAFRHAADIWGDLLDSDVEIRIGATFGELPCDAVSAVLGRAGTNKALRNFAGAPLADTWYPSALADKLAGMDLDPGSGPDHDDIGAEFNGAVGTTCPFPGSWYLGLDGNATGNDSDLVTVVLHELGHGLGFATFVELDSGARLLGANDAFMVHLEDIGTGRRYPEMTDAERVEASTATGDLQWIGPNVVAASGRLSAGVGPSGGVEMYAPDPQEPGSSVSHFSDVVEPNELMEPSFTEALHDVGLTAELFRDLGWDVGSPIVVCDGDCDNSLAVAINELILLVNIALGIRPIGDCEAGDTNEDGSIAINELIGAVNNSLMGCPAPPTPLPTSTPRAMSTVTPTLTPGTPGPTVTPTEADGERCPLDFRDDSGSSEFVCIFAGRWNMTCGGDNLEAIFVSDGEFLIAALGTVPIAGIGAEVTSPTSAQILAWFPDLEGSEDLEPLAGTMTLADGGGRLMIDPSSVPFSIGVDQCGFAAYDGLFTGLVSESAGVTSVWARLQALERLQSYVATR